MYAGSWTRDSSTARQPGVVPETQQEESMRTRRRRGRLAWAVGTVVALVVGMLTSTVGPAAAAESLTVDLASPRGPSTGVGEGFLYGFTSDGTQPVDQFIQPLGINAFRGGGWFSGGWIKDNYQLGSATQADINSIPAAARALTQPPYPAQDPGPLTALHGPHRGPTSHTTYPRGH